MIKDYSNGNMLKMVNEVIIRCQENRPWGYADPNTTNQEWAQYLLDWDVIGYVKVYDC